MLHAKDGEDGPLGSGMVLATHSLLVISRKVLVKQEPGWNGIFYLISSYVTFHEL